MKISFEISRNQAKTAETQPQKKGKRLSGEVNKPQPDRVKMQMATLRQAVENARDPNNPGWIELYEIYRNSMTDSQVRSQYDIAVNKLQAAPFAVARDGDDNDELTQLFMRPWFSRYMQILFDAEMYGYTVVEFGQKDENNEFKYCLIFPRVNIYPANRNVIINNTDTTGIPFGDNPRKYFLVEIGTPDDIGLLELVSREVIWKAFARRDWSELSEKWGKPHLIIKTDAEGEELNKREAAARNFANNAYFITDTEDVIDTLESKNGATGYQIFEKNIRLIDEQIAKLMNGQTGAADEMAYVGAAEVHERVLNDYHAARLRRYSNHINYELIPFLIYFGYPLLPTDKLRFTELDPDDVPETNPEEEEGTTQPPKGGQNPQPTKGGQNQRLWLKKKIVAASPGELLEKWLKRFFESGGGTIDPEIWGLNFSNLLKGIQKAGLKFDDTYQYKALAEELRTNAAAFAAFKNHDEQKVLADLLTSPEGKPVSWNDFRKAALPYTETYNKEWLKTEFAQAQANAQMAVKWKGFEEAADLYPNLEYRTAGDSEVRPEHAILDGVILPINDPFWSRNYPPNGWGCRCTVTQTDKDTTKDVPKFKAGAGFDSNPGKDGKLFADSNGYRKGTPKTDRPEVEKQGGELLKKYLNE